MKVVIDASVAARAGIAGGLPRQLARHELIAPTLLWSEATAAIRQQEWRRDISSAVAARAISWLSSAAISPHPSRDLLVDAHALARQLGWAKSYDAEYVVLAQQLHAGLLTLDARLARGVAALVEVLDPASL